MAKSREKQLAKSTINTATDARRHRILLFLMPIVTTLALETTPEIGYDKPLCHRSIDDDATVKNRYSRVLMELGNNVDQDTLGVGMPPFYQWIGFIPTHKIQLFSRKT